MRQLFIETKQTAFGRYIQPIALHCIEQRALVERICRASLGGSVYVEEPVLSVYEGQQYDTVKVPIVGVAFICLGTVPEGYVVTICKIIKTLI